MMNGGGNSYTDHLKLVLAQINCLVGDLDGNARRVAQQAALARRRWQADVVIFPELCLSGYPPEDFLLRASFMDRMEETFHKLCRSVGDYYVVVGYPRRQPEGLQNMAGVLHRGRCIAEYAKQQLPNYQVFDEKRYFVPGKRPKVVPLRGVPVALSICEDLWTEQNIRQSRLAYAVALININASPFHRGKQQEREELLARRATRSGMPVIYVNMTGGQDELVFDGGSMAVCADGELRVRGPSFREGLFPVDLYHESRKCWLVQGNVAPPMEDLTATYEALVVGLRDYVDKNGFEGVVLGLSGGIDSALSLVLAVDALGASRVRSVMMPFKHTSAMSKQDAARQAKNLGVRHQTIPIDGIYQAFMAALKDEFAGLPADVSEENIQARCRGVLLMAISNKTRSLVLTTGNKSELAVGYATLYGDMAGGFDVLKDVSKTLVYELAKHRNKRRRVIPLRVLERPPSAELAPDQRDEDSLPPYPLLDSLLELYVEQDLGPAELVAKGFDPQVVEQVLKLVDGSEYKRHQAPPGVRITRRGFGRDRRYPISNGWDWGPMPARRSRR